MVEPPKLPPTFNTPVHSTHTNQPARDLVTHIYGTPKEIAIGALLEGKVLSQTSSGLTTLQTSHGDITFQTQIGLLKGSLIALRVISTGTDFQARIVTVNGQTLGEYLGTNLTGDSGRVSSRFSLNPSATSAPQGQQHGAVTYEAASKTTLQSVQQNAVMSTTLLEANQAGFKAFVEQLPAPVREQLVVALNNTLRQNAAVNTTLSADKPESVAQLLARSGNVIDFRVLRYTPVATETSSSVPPAGQNQTPTAPQSAQTTPPSTAGSQQGGTPPPTPHTNHITTPSLHVADKVIIDPKTGQVRVPAVVIGAEKNGVSVLKTPLGTFHISASLAKGTQLELEAIGVSHIALPTVATTPGSMSATQDALGKLLAFWKLFGDSETLQNLNKGTQQAVLERFPSPHKDMGSKILRYFSAVNSQDADTFLGKQLTESITRNAGREFVDQLQRDLGGFRQLWNQPQNDWRTLIFPVVSDGMWYENKLMVKDYEGRNTQEEMERGTRFVLELSLEKLGPLQLDGLVHGRGSKQVFDLTLRSQEPLPKDMRNGILTIFQEAQEDMAMDGTLAFQQVKTFPQVLQEGATTPYDDSSILA